MGAEDGIVVTQDGDTIDIEDQEAGTEYKIELAESKLRNNLLITEDYDKNDSMGESYVEDDEIKEEMKDFDEGYGKRHMDEEPDRHMDEEPNDDETMYEIHLGEDDDIEELGEEMSFNRSDIKNDKYHIEDLEDDIRDRREFREGHQGSPSKTRPGRMDYRTHRGDKDFDQDGNRFTKGAYGTEIDEMDHMDKEMKEFHKGSRSTTDPGRMDFTTKKGMEYDEDGKRFTKSPYDEKHMGEMDHSDEEVGEASRTYGFGSKSGRGLRKAISNNRNYEYPMNESTKKSVNKIIATAKQLQTENRQFREKNKEYRQALKVFRDKLNEVAVFNANLAYSTKIFTEHTTTKKEKVNVLRRFDNVTTLNESKNLFNSLNSEFKSKVNKLNESVQKTITKTPSGGSSVNLIESKTYESPQITRMREIMGKL